MKSGQLNPLYCLTKEQTSPSSSWRSGDYCDNHWLTHKHTQCPKSHYLLPYTPGQSVLYLQAPGAAPPTQKLPGRCGSTLAFWLPVSWGTWRWKRWKLTSLLKVCRYSLVRHRVMPRQRYTWEVNPGGVINNRSLGWRQLCTGV